MKTTTKNALTAALLCCVMLTGCGGSKAQTETPAPEEKEETTQQTEPQKQAETTDSGKKETNEPKTASESAAEMKPASEIKSKEDLKLSTEYQVNGSTITVTAGGNTDELEYAWYLQKENKSSGEYEKVSTVSYKDGTNTYQQDVSELETGNYFIKAFIRLTGNDEIKRSKEAVHFSYDASAKKLVVVEKSFEELTLDTDYSLENKKIAAKCGADYPFELEYAWYLEKAKDGEYVKIDEKEYGKDNEKIEYDISKLDEGYYLIKVYARVKDYPSVKKSQTVCKFEV